MDSYSLENTQMTNQPISTQLEMVPNVEALVGEVRELYGELEAREQEIRTLRADVESLKKDREQATNQMASLERSCRMLAMQVLRLGGPNAAVVPVGNGKAAGDQKALFAATAPAGVRPSASCGAVAAGPGRAAVQAGKAVATAPQFSPVSVVHWETYEPLRSTVQAAAARWSAVYSSETKPAEPVANTRRVLVLNLLGAGAIQWIGDQARLNPRRTSAYTYVFDCGRGLLLGTMDYMPLSMDVRADVERYVENQTARRILIVGGDFDVVSHMQEALAGRGCTTSTALNSKQALDLVPTIKPDLVMLDMRLPRESSVRLAYHLRNYMTGFRHLPITFFWRERGDLADFHEQSLTAIRDAVLSPDDLARGLATVLSPAP